MTQADCIYYERSINAAQSEIHASTKAMAKRDNLTKFDYLDALNGLVAEVSYLRWAENFDRLLDLTPSDIQTARGEALAGVLQDRFDRAHSRVTQDELLALYNDSLTAPSAGLQ